MGAAYDYGPYGAQLKKNIKDTWWKCNVERRTDVFGLDAAIIQQQEVFEASGHLAGFNDILVDCKECKHRFRLDHLVQIDEKNYKCQNCDATINTDICPPRKFNLMLKTELGVVEGAMKPGFLRPETAQGIFVNFANVNNSVHPKLPFGIGQIGKSFRNEVTTKSFIFRTREFEQMEIEYFVAPEDADQAYVDWVDRRFRFYVEELGIRPENLSKREHAKDELAHYAKGCTDIEYKFPWGFAELEGIAHRADYDLTQHAKHSGEKLEYLDPYTNKKFTPFVIEPSAGVDRTLLAVLCDAYAEEQVKDDTRVVLRFSPKIAPVKCAIFPLLKNKPELVAFAKKLHADLSDDFIVSYDEGNIGKMYRRQDEVGTPYCVTVDFTTLEDGTVTVRDRDSMEQIRVPATQMEQFLREKIKGKK
jgi:glycyl-tRNA synthetase